jgi:hypothetical protein
MSNDGLANIIFWIHCIFILFILVIPFTNIPVLLMLHIIACVSLFIHWKTNSNICSLTILEAKLRGLNHTDTFMHRVVSPIYNINDNTIWFITFALMCLSIYKLYKNKYKFKAVQNCFSKLKPQKNMFMSLVKNANCFQPLYF